MPLIKILLIDDDEDDYILTKDLLPANKYELSWIDNYQEGITAVVKGLYDVYLVDYRLGKFSGVDLLNEAVKSNCTKPVIILTGKGDSKIDEEALRLGAADYLVKDEINGLLLERSIRYSLEHHKTLKKLKDSENKFRIIFERSKDPMLITDTSGKIYEVNTAAVNFFETNKELLLLQNAASLNKSSESWDIFTSIMEEKGAVSDLEFELVTNKGKVKYCSLFSFLQIPQHGSQQLYFITIHDLTHRRLQEQQVILEEKLAAIERIAKNLAEEINNPLSNVNLAIDEIKTTHQEQDALILLDIIKKNCERINNLTSGLIESTQFATVRKKETDFNKVLKDALLEAESLFNLEMITKFDDDSPVLLDLDEHNIHSVLLNLFKNAAEAVSEKGKAVVELKKKAGWLIVEITDNGKGIPKEHLDKIFEPFFTTKPRASGLGLTHSQRIMQAHRGKLEVSSNGKNYTRVSVMLPFQ